MLKKVLLRAWLGYGYLSRLALELVLLLLIVGCVLVLGLRYWVLPDIERYHTQITSAASDALGQPLTIGRIAADWNGLRPRLLLSDVKIFDQQGHVALSLPRLENTVAWTSLFTAELRFQRLEIESPDLLVRRDGMGRWSVAGIALAEGAAGDGGAADWLLHQSNIVIRNGRVSWQDELRAAPQLVFEQVALRIENRHGRHRFAASAVPPEHLSSRLDVRGSFHGDSFSEMEGWQGELFTQLEYADVQAWKSWISLPQAFKRGQGALRVWLGVEQGRVHRVDADVALSGVQARLAEELPLLDLREMRGRIGWQGLERGFEISTQQLALQMHDGFKLQPTDFHLRLSGGQGYQQSSGEIHANVLDLSSLSRLVDYVPLASGVKEQLLAARPQGRIGGLRAQWQGDIDHITRYAVQGHFSGLALERMGARPGFSGLSGEVDGSDSGGTFKLDSVNMTLDAPGWFAEPLAFDKASAHLRWQHGARGWEFRLSDASISNADLAGTAYGSYHSEVAGPGILDATVDLKRVSVQHTGRYVPLQAVNPKTQAWLQAALQAGHADSFRLRLRGDLRDFPFVGEERGIFRIEAQAKDVALEFDKAWPRIEDAQAKLLIEGNYLEVTAATAKTAGAHLQKVKVSIPDLLSDAPLLRVQGEAADETRRCLEYVRASPVRGYLGGFTDGIVAKGNGKLDLKLDIPLSGDAALKVAGKYLFADNEVDFGEALPLLRKVNGTLAFDQSSVSADGIKAQILGGPAQLSVQRDNSALVIKGVGRADADNLRKAVAHPVLQRVRGYADWNTEIRVQDKQVSVAVASDLLGLESSLPAPLNKRANERIPLRLDQSSNGARQDAIGMHYGNVLHARLVRHRDTDGALRIQRGWVALGGERATQDKEGVWIVGRLPQLALQGWTDLTGPTAGREVLPDIAGIDVTLDKLVGYGSTVNGLNIKGSSRNGLVSLRLTARELNGDVIWQPQGNGKLLVRLKSAMLGEGPHDPNAQPETPPVERAVDRSAIPTVDVIVDKLSYKRRQLGRLELQLSDADGDVQLDNLRLTNPDGVLNMSGKWFAAPERTQVQLRLDISDAGKILSRSGYPDSLKEGKGSLDASLNWVGAPNALQYPRLNGNLHLNVGKGRFLKVNAGAGKLLGVLSLQALPKRITLDFTDVFSEGFDFESITGNAQIMNGLLLTNDMKLTGAAAKVTLQGQVDLGRETQELKVRILPTLSDNVSLLSFAAGPAVGVGVLLTNKLLRDPLDKLVSFEYNVSGSWADPKVEKVGASKPPQEGGAPAR